MFKTDTLNFKHFLLMIGLILAVGPMAAQCENKPETIDFMTQTPGAVDFGKTSTAAYTPAIRENMKRLYEDKFGLFVHFGPYAQLEGVWNGKEVAAEWIMNRAEISIADYETHAAGRFKPGKFDAGEWVSIAESAGMGFIVVTAKHHDGFAMYDSFHPYNLVDFAGFERDILKELAVESAKRDMALGFYYSQSQDWHEKGGYGNGWDFPARMKPQTDFDAYFEEKAVEQVKELTTNYGDIFMVWFDTPAQMDDAKSRQMMDIVKANQPAALVSSRLGQGFGHFDVSIDNGNMPNVSTATWLPDLKVPWQTHQSVTTRGWGYTRYGGESDRSAEYADFVYSLARIVGNGGVYLLNVGPRPDGTIPESQVNSLKAIGDWLKVNGESIYGADPSPFKFPPYPITSKPGKLYLHIKDVEQEKVALDGLLSKVSRAYLLADSSERPLSFVQKDARVSVLVPTAIQQPRVTVVVLETGDEVAQVVDETLQQDSDGTIRLPVAKSEYSIRRISYDYEKQVTHRWGESEKQGLIWSVNVSRPGEFKIYSEDNSDDQLQYELITADDKRMLDARGEIDTMDKRQREGTIRIEIAGVQKIAVYPRVLSKQSRRFEFKGLELVLIK